MNGKTKVKQIKENSLHWETWVDSKSFWDEKHTMSEYEVFYLNGVVK